MRKLKLIVIVAVALLALHSGSLNAQPTGADAGTLARARFESGLTHYNLTEYREALTDFIEAYRIKRDPVFLFNIGQCHRQLGDFEKAAQFYRNYLREMPGARNRIDVERFIADADKAAVEKRAQAQPTAVQTPRLDPAPPKATAAPATQAPRLDPAPKPEVAPTPPVTLIPAVAPTPTTEAAASRAEPDVASKRSRTWLWVGISVAAVIVAGAGVGLGVALSQPTEPSSKLGTFTAVFQ